MLPVLAGTLSEGVAREFVAYTDLCNRLPSIKDIQANPTGISIDSEPSMLYAVSHQCAAYLDEKNIDILVPYIERLPIEFSIILMRGALKRNKQLIKTEAGRAWSNKLSEELF